MHYVQDLITKDILYYIILHLFQSLQNKIQKNRNHNKLHVVAISTLKSLFTMASLI